MRVLDPLAAAMLFNMASKAEPETRSDRWSQFLTFLTFWTGDFDPHGLRLLLLRTLLTRVIFVKRTLQRGHVFSRSAHLAMQPKQKMCSQPLIFDASSLDGSHMHTQQTAPSDEADGLRSSSASKSSS